MSFDARNTQQTQLRPGSLGRDARLSALGVGRNLMRKQDCSRVQPQLQHEHGRDQPHEIDHHCRALAACSRRIGSRSRRAVSASPLRSAASRSAMQISRQRSICAFNSCAGEILRCGCMARLLCITTVTYLLTLKSLEASRVRFAKRDPLCKNPQHFTSDTPINLIGNSYL